jgi:hypothetical protein
MMLVLDCKTFVTKSAVFLKHVLCYSKYLCLSLTTVHTTQREHSGEELVLFMGMHPKL